MARASENIDKFEEKQLNSIFRLREIDRHCQSLNRELYLGEKIPIDQEWLLAGEEILNSSKVKSKIREGARAKFMAEYKNSHPDSVTYWKEILLREIPRNIFDLEITLIGWEIASAVIKRALKFLLPKEPVEDKKLEKQRAEKIFCLMKEKKYSDTVIPNKPAWSWIMKNISVEKEEAKIAPEIIKMYHPEKGWPGNMRDKQASALCQIWKGRYQQYQASQKIGYSLTAPER